MRPEYEKITEPAERSFTAKIVSRESRPLLSQAWHFHPEIEICYTYRSHGKRFVGNQISDYAVGDLVMFGSNLPHGFTTDMPCEQVVIQMTHDFMGRDFIDKPELRILKNLFARAKQGLSFGPETREEAKDVIHKLIGAQGMIQLVHLLHLLDLLAKSVEVAPICSKEYSLELDATHLKRIKLVYDYILQNFRQEMSVREVAEQINLTEAAFFKFIKRHTKKTFTEIVNEFRVNHASKLLMATDMTVAEVCYDSGFNNVSYFNRKFKAITQQTPGTFKQKYK